MIQSDYCTLKTNFKIFLNNDITEEMIKSVFEPVLHKHMLYIKHKLLKDVQIDFGLRGEVVRM